MTAGHGDPIAVGGPARHLPVLRDQILAALHPCSGGFYLDATFGAGGYSQAILAIPGTKVLALDRDPTSVAAGADMVRVAQARLVLERARFSNLEQVARLQGIAAFDGIVFDVGVSSMQLDEAERGFSFRHDGPLDMRMERAGKSAGDLVNGTGEAELADILYYFGEERAARRIAKAIVAERSRTPIATTGRLAEIIARAAPGKPGAIHPATRSFQALRIAVNDELGELVSGLTGAERMLKEGGCLAVVTFHSLEDRIVKQFFAARSGRGESASRRLPGEPAKPAATFALLDRRPIEPSEAEIKSNPRARSAKLRFGIRTVAPPQPVEPALLDLARLPQPQRRR